MTYPYSRFIVLDAYAYVDVKSHFDSGNVVLPWVVTT